MNHVGVFSRRYLLRYLPWYASGTLALAATNWLSVTIPVTLAEGIDALALGEAGRPILVSTALTVAAMGIGVMVVRTASRLLFFTPGRLVEAEVKRDLFERLLRQQPAFLAQWPTGDLVSRMTSDTTMVRLLAGFAAMGIINTTVALTLTGIQMFRLSPELAAWMMLPMAAGFAVTLGFVNRLFLVMRRLQEQAASLSDHALSSYRGVAVVQSFGAQEAFEERFEHHNRAYLATTLERANLRIVIGPTLSLAASVNVFLLLFIGGPLTARGELTVGELVAFTTLVGYLIFPLRGLSFIISIYKQSTAALERIHAVLLPEIDRPDLPGALAPPAGAPHIQVQGLSFAYPEAPDQPVLRDISLDVPAGSTLGILGATGSGKTTLLRLIARLYNPPEGTVRVDDQDIRSLDLDAWRRQLAFVPQKAFLFSERVRDNIQPAGGSDAELNQVLTLTALQRDMAALPDGVDTLVGESGMTLSGGQRQRVALARGLIRPHRLLLLDDVLSAVDHSTEAQLLEALRHGDRRTTIIVANRISALSHADQIAVMEDGTVVAIGDHSTLMQASALYRDTWNRQAEAEA
jgi:ATP-binding cassette, subfamily B, multidrug efflux pump